MIKSVTPQLMFTGNAKQAMDLYVEAFDGAVLEEQHYPTDHPSQAGQILRAVFQIGDQQLACIDSEDVHGFTFTPSMSLFVEMGSLDALTRVFDDLSGGGMILMPMDSYGFSERFVWFNDKFGVSWQLNYQGSSGKS